MKYTVYKKMRCTDLAYDYIELQEGGGPLYQQLYLSLKAAMEGGRLKQGERMPSIRKFSEDLGVSRTTVEGAYQQLCVEGYLKSEPKRGYFVLAGEQPPSHPRRPSLAPPPSRESFRYNLGTDCADGENADLKIWKRHVRDVLNRKELIVSYGDHQGEKALRQALSQYASRARGVSAGADELGVGAGSQPLLYLLCGLAGERRVAIEERGFAQAEQVFSDCGMEVLRLPSDQNGLNPEALLACGARLAYVSPSSPVSSGSAMPTSRRFQLLAWAQQTGGILVEDDYNGELRYNARPIPAMQGMAGGERVAYLGSFSKLLLPSVRVGYMALPPALLPLYRARAQNYNQTASKIEQLALAAYISSGQMERRLRRLRKLYAAKSQQMGRCLAQALPGMPFTLRETALYYSLPVPEALAQPMCQAAARHGLRVRPRRSGLGPSLALSFSGLPLEDIPQAIGLLGEAWASFLPCFQRPQGAEEENSQKTACEINNDGV